MTATPRKPATSRVPGFLECKKCKTRIPFQSNGNPEDTPLHRCVDRQVRPLKFQPTVTVVK